MKKLFAVFLGICACVMMFGFNAQTENTVKKDKTQFSHQKITDGKLTLDVIGKVESWEQFINKTIPSLKIEVKPKNEEDRYCILLINGIQTPMVATIYHNQRYLYYSIGGINYREINRKRLIKKFENIINLYNETNDLQLVMKHRVLNDTYMEVDIFSKNVFLPVTHVGERVTLRTGAIYWESPVNDGSGKCGTRIPEGEIVVNGFAYYTDESRSVIAKSYYKPYNELNSKEEIIINPWEYRMIHVCTPTLDLGWVYAEDVMSITPKQKESK